MQNKKQTFRSSGFSKIILIILAAVIVLAVAGGIFYLSKEEALPPVPSVKPPQVLVELTPAALAKRLIGPDDIVLEKIEVNPQIPPYNLPLSTADIVNYQDFSNKIQLSPRALSLLQKNGFVVIETPEDIAQSKVFLMRAGRQASPEDDFVAYYQAIKDKDLPVFITTDSLLHYYHIFFGTTLMRLERDLFYDDVWQMSKELLDDAIYQYNNTSGDLKESAKRNVAYLAVALELLRPKEDQLMTEANLTEEYGMVWDLVKETYGEKASFKYFPEADLQRYSFEVPDFVQDLVENEIELIKKHEGWEYSPIFIYKEDYSQYVPRGHYTKSEKLKNYFKSMMWYGRMTALIKGSPDLQQGKSFCSGPLEGIISEYDAKIQTLQASLVAGSFSQSSSMQERWNRMYAITGFFVGFSDDLGPYEYSEILSDLFKEEIMLENYEKRYSDIRDALLELSYNPKIYGGLGDCELSMPPPPLSDEEIQALKVQAEELLESTKGFRLMGQRFTIDSWLFSEIVSPYSGQYTGDKAPRPFTCVKTPLGREVKGFPRGLDLMALLGSERAREILEELGDTEYSDYEKKFSELKTEIDSIPIEDWFQNLYWNWLYALRSLFEEYGQGYQTFMQTKAWQDKNLNTALASWAQLRHDTILYVKQSYTMAEMGGGPIDPPVVGYVEPAPEFYARLLTLTKMTNQGLKRLISQEDLEKLKIEAGLDRFADILERLLEISEKQLENKTLSDEDYRFIKNFGTISEDLIDSISGGDIDPEIFKTVMVADVHTDGNTREVLEEGVGYIKTLAVAYKHPQGHILLGVGPAFSYYEFKQPMADRLTDEAWRKLLETEEAPPKPEWIKSFSE